MNKFNALTIACTDYFQAHESAFHRLLEQMRSKWKSYGKAAGRIILKDATQEEREELEGLFGTAFSETDISFPVNKFEQALQKTKYQGVLLEDVLSCYFNEPLSTNAEDRKARNTAIQLFHQDILSTIQNEDVKIWFSELYPKSFQHCRNTFENDAVFQEMVHTCEKAYVFLKKREEPVRLSVLSMKYFHNPHALDQVNPQGKLFFALLYHQFQKENGTLFEKSGSPNAEAKMEVYMYFGIRQDDISSFTCMQGFHFYQGE